MGGEVGPVYEIVISRTRYVSAQTDNKTRIVALSVPLANARDFGDWMGASAHAIFNFMPRYGFSQNALGFSDPRLVHDLYLSRFTFKVSISRISLPS